MATIANLNVKLSANILGFTTGMRAALKPLAQFGKGISGATRSLTSFTGLAGGALTVGALTVFVKHSMEAIDTVAKLSDRLGISTEALTGLQHAANLAGVDAEGLTGGLQKMLKSLSDAATGTPAAAAAFQQLGLNAQELVNDSPDEAFKRIADSLLAVQNPATRAALSMEVFGKAGQSLLPLLMSGSEGIKAAQAEAAKLGLTFNRMDAAKVEAANDAMTKLGAAFTGAGNALAIQLAPFITAISDKLVAVGTSGQGMAGNVVNAFETVLTVIAKACDWLELLKGAFYTLRGVAALSLSGLIKMLGLVIQGIEWLSNKLTGSTSNWGDTFRIWGDNVKADADASFSAAGESFDKFATGANSKAVTQTFAEIRAAADKSAKAIADNALKLNGAKAATEDWGKSFADAKKKAEDIGKVIEGLTTDLATFGMGDGEKKLFDLKALGADPAQLDQAKKLIASLDVKKTAQDIGKAMDSIKGDLASAGLSDIDAKLLDLSNLGATPAQLERAKAMLEQIDLANADKPKTEASKGPELLLAGSAEAQKLAYQATIGIKTTTNDVQSRQLAAAKDGNTWLDRIERNTRGAAAGLPAFA